MKVLLAVDGSPYTKKMLAYLVENREMFMSGRNDYVLLTVVPQLPNRATSAISKTYRFANFYETMAFVNALALIAHQQDHHPDLEVGYNRCKVSLNTHDVGGISETDIDCARRIEALLNPA